jgi:HK97 family phage portal protein
MTVERVGDGLLYIYEGDTANKKEYNQNEILHIKGFGDGVMGLSALAHARHTLGISVSADRYASRSFSGRPNGALTLDRILTSEQRAELRKVYGGLESSSVYNADGQMMILEGGMKYEGFSMPPDDLQMLESRTFQVPEICRFFGVPSVMVDGSAGATAAWPASYEQQVLSFLTFGLKPYLEEWEDKVTFSLLSPSERSEVFAEHNVEGLLRTDSQARASYLSTMVQNGLMSRNESRMKLNLPRVEGGDELTVQVNLTGINDLPKAVNDVTE